MGETKGSCRRLRNNTLDIDQNEQFELSELVTEGSTIGVVSENDIQCGFNLLKVTRKHTIYSSVTDDFNNSLTPDTPVFFGHFYNRESLIDMTYTLCEKKTAVVHQCNLRYICGEIKRSKKGRKTIFKLTMSQQEDIISCL